MSSLERIGASPFFQTDIGVQARRPDFLANLYDHLDWQREGATQLGQLLCFAIINGALLDSRGWQGWSNALPYHRIEGELLWIDYQINDKRSPVEYTSRQWFADPLTRELIRRWTRARCRLPQLDARTCLLKFLRKVSGDPNLSDSSIDEMVDWATFWWRLRMPSMLVSQARGELGTTALSRTEFDFLVKPSIIRNPRTSGRKEIVSRPRAEKASREWYSRFRDRDGPESRVFAHVRRLRAQGDHSERKLRLVCISWLDQASKTLARQRKLSSGRLQLIEWCLSQFEIDRRPSNLKGYAPWTVENRLVTMLEGILGGKYPPRAQSERSVKRRLRLAIKNTACPTQIGLMEAAATDFCHFLANPQRRGQKIVRTFRTIEVGEALLEELTSNSTVEGVSAKLISTDVYRSAIEKSYDSWPVGEIAIIIMLAFRTGMRMREILGLLITDFVMIDDHFELHLDHNRYRRLKTKGSRRILHLKLLLTEHEQAALRKWLQPRIDLPPQPARQVLCFGPVGGRSLPNEKWYTKVTEEALQSTGNKGLLFQHLRHSFGSYLMLRLLMPEPESQHLVPAAFRDFVTWDQKAKDQNALLGRGRLGQSAAHAVSMIMGHTGIPRTLRSYQHLMDLAVGLQVNRLAVQPALPIQQLDKLGWAHGVKDRRRDAVKKERKYLRASFKNLDKLTISDEQSAPIAISHGQEVIKRKPGPDPFSPGGSFAGARKKKYIRKPQWRLLHQMVTQDQATASAIAEEHNYDPADVAKWRARYQQIIGAMFEPGALPKGLRIPRGSIAEQMIDTMWNRLPVKHKRSVPKLIELYLDKFCPCDRMSRMPSLPLARALACLFRRLGFSPSHIGIAYGPRRDIRLYKKQPWHLKELEVRGRPAFLGQVMDESQKQVQGSPAIWLRYWKYPWDDELGRRFTRRYRLDAFHDRWDKFLGDEISDVRSHWDAYRQVRRSWDAIQTTVPVYNIGNTAYQFCILLIAIFYDVLVEPQFVEKAPTSVHGATNTATNAAVGRRSATQKQPADALCAS